MIFRRGLAVLIASTALAACGACAVWLLCAALYLLVLPWLGPAGAAAVLALVLAAALAGAAAIAAALLAPRQAKRRESAEIDTSPLQSLSRVVAFVQARPVTAVTAAAVVAGLAATSPRLLLLGLRALIPRRRTAA